jgi:hypothetical protein
MGNINGHLLFVKQDARVGLLCPAFE